MNLLNHLQNIQQEITTLKFHGDHLAASLPEEVSIEAIEYHVEKAIRIHLRREDNESSDEL